MTHDNAPLLVTLTLDEGSFAYFNDLRIAHFPPERNHIPAHMTLFHALPGLEQSAIETRLAQCAATTSAFAMTTSGLMFMGGGTAYTFDAPDAVVLRATLAEAFRQWLTPQDAHRFKPHITIQNKVEGTLAKQFYTEFSAAYTPRDATAIGLDLWHYRGGPWEHARFFGFKD